MNITLFVVILAILLPVGAFCTFMGEIERTKYEPYKPGEVNKV